MERKQNWNKFRALVGGVAPKRQGLLLLGHEQKVLAGANIVSSTNKENTNAKYFVDQGIAYSDGESLWSDLESKYSADGATLLERNELLRCLGEVSSAMANKGLPESYFSQLKTLRAQFGVESGQNNSCAQHFGDKPVAHFWPDQHFLLQIFRPLFAELLPERKLLLLGVVKGTELQSIVLEFVGAELRTFAEPDFSSLDWQGQDLFHRNTLERFVNYMESRYVLPTYAFFLSSSVWEECQALQRREGGRSAWKHLLRHRRQRENDPEICIHPESWPLKAALQWQGNN